MNPNKWYWHWYLWFLLSIPLLWFAGPVAGSGGIFFAFYLLYLQQQKLKKPLRAELLSGVETALHNTVVLHATVQEQLKKDSVDSLHLWVFKDGTVKAVVKETGEDGFDPSNTREVIKGKVGQPFTTIPYFERAICLGDMDVVGTGLFQGISRDIQKATSGEKLYQECAPTISALAEFIFIAAQLDDFCS